jgi:hypothetical protein
MIGHRVSILGRRVLAPLALAAGLLVAGGPASAQDACGTIQDQPDALFDQLMDQLGDFLPLSDELCEQFVDVAVTACHKAVGVAAECQRRVNSSVPRIGKAICRSDDRDAGACKLWFKQQYAGTGNHTDLDTAEAHEICEDEFQDDITDACLNGAP